MNPNKLNLTAGVINLFVLIFLAHIVFFQQKVVYVDFAKLLNDYKGMQAARAAYQQKAVTWKIFQYEKESPKMTAKERQLSQELIRTKQNQLAQYQNALNTQAQQEDQKMTGEVVSQINAYLKKYGESKG